VHLICDNYATHKHPKVQAWAKKNPRFAFHFTPTSASWLNMVERFFRDLSEKALKRGSFYDVALARTAHAAGKGAKFRARFNSERGLPCDVPFEADAEVVGLHDGNIVGRLGIFQGKRLRLGPCAALRIGGVTVVVISDRSQTAEALPAILDGLRRRGFRFTTLPD